MDFRNSVEKAPVQFYQRRDGMDILSEFYLPSHRLGLTCTGEVFKSNNNRYSKETIINDLAIRDIRMNIPFDYEETYFPLEYANLLRAISFCSKLTEEQNEFIKNLIPKIFPERVLPPKECICPKVTQVREGAASETRSQSKPKPMPTQPKLALFELPEEDLLKFPEPLVPLKAAALKVEKEEKPVDNSGSDEKVNPFICPITQEIMKDPVSAADGHSYERSAIELWLSKHDTSPMTNELLPNKTLTPNWALKGAIEFTQKK